MIELNEHEVVGRRQRRGVTDFAATMDFYLWRIIDHVGKCMAQRLNERRIGNLWRSIGCDHEWQIVALQLVS